MSKQINGCSDAEVHSVEQLADNISVIWCAEDVLDVDDSLTDYQARLVLRQLDEKHDASIGINWEVVEYTIDAMCSGGEL